MKPWFIATQKFDNTDVAWRKYIAWSRLNQLDEVVSLDAGLCPTVLPEVKAEYWDHIVRENFMLHYFTDLGYLRNQISDKKRINLLCVFRDPAAPPNSFVPEGFEFVGYDLVDVESSVSALTNCGGFPRAFSNDELSEKGLLRSRERGRQVQADMRVEYPHDPHANCHLWAIFRAA